MGTDLPTNGEIGAPVRKRRGLPLLPTLLVAIAVPILAGFGVWQLQRMQWKEALLQDLARNEQAQLLDVGQGPIPATAQFRQVQIYLTCPPDTATQRAGRNSNGQSGYAHLVPCNAGAEVVTLDAGWTARPASLPLPAVNGPVQGRLVEGGGGQWILVATEAVPPLVPSAPPGPETISNNHFSYAIQWFSFAAILLAVYAVYLRRWRRG